MSSEPPPPSIAADLLLALGPELAEALSKKGYSSLTPVQASVLDPALAGRDLRISSQTGSGKTLAIGFALRETLQKAGGSSGKGSHPRAIAIVPTRELAKQVHLELSWLFAPLKVKITSVTGGASYRDELRALAQNPAVVVGTPGRLLDHLKQGSIQTGDVGAVVLDEADQMLDLGFREDLEAILALMPAERHTHLVSATFPREVTALADRVQKNAKRVEGTPLGSANADIDHLIYLVLPNERLAALVNVLLHHPEEQTLIFARTRADVADITRELQLAGFAVGSLSGEMEQQARNRALFAFKRGDLRVLVATDVAARGIDVQDIARVIQVDVPTNADIYTHRSGRTGRAGRKGTSALLLSPAGMRRATAVLSRARVQFRVEPVPSAETIRTAQDERWLAELVNFRDSKVPEHIQNQVARIIAGGHTEHALARLIGQLQKAVGEPREVTPLSLQPERGRRPFERDARSQDSAGPARGPRRDPGNNTQWVSFRVTWGEAHGADARRLVAMLCRRGNIRGSDIGAIRVAPTFSNVDVAANVAKAFADATRDPDPRDPRVKVTLASQQFKADGAKPPYKGKGAPPARPHYKPPAAPAREYKPSAPVREHKPAAGSRPHQNKPAAQSRPHQNKPAAPLTAKKKVRKRIVIGRDDL